MTVSKIRKQVEYNEHIIIFSINEDIVHLPKEIFETYTLSFHLILILLTKILNFYFCKNI